MFKVRKGGGEEIPLVQGKVTLYFRYLKGRHVREDLDLFCAVLEQNFILENKRQCRYDLYFRYLKTSHIWEI